MARPEGGGEAGGEGYSAFDCFTASYGTLLAWVGGDPVVLGDEWGFWWRENAGPVSPIDGLSIARRSLDEVLAYWYGLRTNAVAHESVEAAWSYACAAAATGWPVILAVDSYHLPHSPHQGSLHFPHRIVLVGTSAATADIVDSYAGAPFRGHLPAAVVRQAMSAVGRHGDESFDAEARHRTVDLRRQAVTSPALDQAKVRARLTACCDGYLGDQADRGPVGGRSTGRDALRRAAQALRASAGTPLSATGFVEVLARVGEVAGQRLANAQFLRAAAGVLDLPELAGLADSAERTGKAWLLARNLVYLRASGPDGVPPRLADRLDALADADQELSAGVRAALVRTLTAVRRADGH
jgi:Butirosin biosynthesis protein H, N-terminal